jgi:hypothetical protein
MMVPTPRGADELVIALLEASTLAEDIRPKPEAESRTGSVRLQPDLVQHE